MATKKKAAPKKPAPRKDFGAPVETYLAKFDGEQRKILDALHALIVAAAPKASGALKWGMPMWSESTKMVCALRVTKTGVGLLLSGPPEIFVDPDGVLEGEAQNMRQLKVTSVKELPKKQITTWLKAAAAK